MLLDINDMGQHLHQSIFAIETDSSENGILNSTDSTRKLLIQDTGMSQSQSLNATLVSALINHKKTIVVYEKITALEALHNTLNDLGLGDQCLLINDLEIDRETVVNFVRNRIDNSISKGYQYNHSIESQNNFISRCKSLIGLICNPYEKLDENSMENINWSQIVNQLLMRLKNTEEEIQLELDRTYEFNPQELDEQLKIVEKGQRLFNEYKAYKEFSFINPKKLTGDNPKTIEQRINDDFQYYSKEIEDIKALEEKFKNQYFKIRKEELSDQVNTREEIHQAIKQVIGVHRQSLDFLNEEKTNGVLYKILSVFSGEKKKVLKGQKLIRTLFTDLVNHLNSSKDLHKLAFNASIEINCWRLIDLKESVEKVQSSFDEIIADEYNNLNLFDISIAEYHTKILDDIKKKGFRLADKIKSDGWLMVKVGVTNFDTFISDIERIIRDKNEFFVNKKVSFNLEFYWFQFYNGLSNANRSLVDKLKIKKDWRKVFLIHYLNELLIKLASTYQPSSNNEHGELKESSSKLGKNQMRYLKEYWYAKQMSTKNRFDAMGKLTVENLYNKRSSHLHQRLSLAQIVKLNPVLFNTFFPIILTTPEVCSNLFKDMNEHFDMVLFDETSQIRLKENIPALSIGEKMSGKPMKVGQGRTEESRKSNGKLISFKNPIETVLSSSHADNSLGVFNDVKRYLDDGYLSKVELDIIELHLFPKSSTDFHTLDQIALNNNLTKERVIQIRSGAKQRLQDLILDLWKTSKHEQLYFNEQMFILTKKDVNKINNTEQVNFHISFVNFVLSAVCTPSYYFQEINVNAPNYMGIFVSPIPGFNFKEFFKDILSVKDASRNNDISFTLENLMSGYFDAESQYIPNIHKPKIVSALQLLTSIVNNEKNKIEVNESELKFVRTKKK